MLETNLWVVSREENIAQTISQGPHQFEWVSSFEIDGFSLHLYEIEN